MAPGESGPQGLCSYTGHRLSLPDEPSGPPTPTMKQVEEGKVQRWIPQLFSQVEERKAELVAMSMKDLQATKDSIQTETSVQPRTPAKAQNPTKPNANEKGSIVVDANGEQVNKPETKTEDSNKKSSVQDYAEEIIKKLARR